MASDRIAIEPFVDDDATVTRRDIDGFGACPDHPLPGGQRSADKIGWRC